MLNTKTLFKFASAMVLIIIFATILWLILGKSEQNTKQNNKSSVDTRTIDQLADSSKHAKPSIDDSCTPQLTRNWAYQINASLTTSTDDKPVYESNISFTLDFAEQSKQVKGLATAINMTENGKSNNNLADVKFLAFNQSEKYAQFGFFDDLGLTANHPMKLLNPLIKNLSVASNAEQVVYPYDPFAINYVYQHKFPNVTRTSNGKDSRKGAKDIWQVTLAEDCLVQTLEAVEALPFKLGSTDAVMTYHFKAKRIPSSRSLDELNFSASVNRDNNWDSTVVQADDFAKNINNDTDMWQAFKGFAHSKSIGQLKKAAAYLMQNHTPIQTAKMLMDSDNDESAKRDLAFALSLVEGNQVQDYILDTLSALPKETDAQGEVQKVRMMVALSGRSDINATSFNRLMTMRNDPAVSDNIKNNVLISSGKIAQDLAKNGQTQPITTLETTVKNQLQIFDDNAASAILASGNASLETVDNELIGQLNQGTEKSRYAAASVLVRESKNYDRLINHLNQEPSLIVFQSTVSGLDSTKLTESQKTQLTELRNSIQQQPQSTVNKEKLALLNGLTLN